MRAIISGTQARQLMEDDDTLLIDVRNPPEFATGSARSSMVKMILNSMGFQNVSNVGTL